MCGINGFVVLDARPKIDEIYINKIDSMNELLQHRGPDSSSKFINNKVVFGHTRLSIIDLSDAGSQPMTIDGYTITYNGEIYNYIELREELISLGHIFTTSSDTEVLLKAYMEWGLECFHRLNGMWGLAIYDPVESKVILSRDRYGVKPLYYNKHNGIIQFSSEIRPLLSCLSQPTHDKEMMFNFLAFAHSDFCEKTFFSDIFQLKGGTNLVIDLLNGGSEIHQYYDLKNAVKAQDKNMSVTKKVFSDAVDIRLRSDVLVGSCLSGGIDSSAIVSQASFLLPEDKKDIFISVHAISSDINRDESKYAESVALKSSVKLVTLKPSYKDFYTCLDEVVEAQEEPFSSTSIILQFLVMKKAKQEGIKVLLDGQGGDETWLGYSRYFASFLSIKNLKTSIKNINWISNNAKISRTKLILYSLYFKSIFFRKLGFFIKYRGLFKRKVINFNLVNDLVTSYSSTIDLQVNEITKFQLPRLLRYEDKNSMWHSVETRLPFLDYRLVEHALREPINNKFLDGWSKWSIRKIIENLLDKSIAWRKSKFGFEAPEAQWIKEHRSEMIDSINDSKILTGYLKNKIATSDKIEKKLFWRLYSVAKWESKFNVK
jgi:asparagine synthase (glutamine-hydrolysing)